MTRYKALRHIGCDPVSAFFISALNKAFGVKTGIIVFLSVQIEYEP